METLNVQGVKEPLAPVKSRNLRVILRINSGSIFLTLHSLNPKDLSNRDCLSRIREVQSLNYLRGLNMKNVRVKTVVKKPNLYLNFPGATRRDAIEALSKEEAFGLALVKRENREYMGFLKALSLLSNPEEQQLSLLLNKNYPTIKPDTVIEEVAKLMWENRLWEVPVVSDNKLQGVLRVRDLLKFIIVKKSPIEVKEFKSKDYPSAWQGTPLTVIGRIMEFYDTPIVIILGDGGEAVGMVEAYTLLKEGYVETEESSSSLGGMSEGEDWDWNVSKVVVISKSKFRIPLKLAIDVMSTIPKIYSKTSASSVAKTLLDNRKDCCLVVDARGRLEGFLTSLDLLPAIF